MTCTEAKELFVEYLENLLTAEQKQNIESHLENCPQCKNDLANLKSLNQRLSSDTNFFQHISIENAVFNKVLCEQNRKLKQAGVINRRFEIVRKIMKSRITKLAVAAVITFAAALAFSFLNKTTMPAYALEQTIKASHGVQYLHVKTYITSNPDSPAETWLEFAPDGELYAMRFHKPAWMEPDDGNTVIVWKDNKMQLWIKKKNIFATMKDKKVADQVLNTVKQLDPKNAVGNILKAQTAGETNVETLEPQNKADPIAITVTSLKENVLPFKRIVLFVDQATKLINSVEAYMLENNEYKHICTIDFFDYNVPIDSEMFTLENIPSDAIIIDQTKEIGILQGNLTDNQVAVELIRQFLEALIAKDYDKAGTLFGGTPGERMKQTYSKVKFIKIISIGDPVPHSLTGGLFVPCKVEIEKEGKISEWAPEHSYVRRVHGQPQRWEIIGGFMGI
ncbi:MAG: hypothetical protein A2Y12_07805 [Planctomycetes bacterium GWF2_42_9]|nr:MAG: hypothetical protein A2Y12_07805 [Planctomycetes bacterium GWF2_42_9]